MTIIVKASREPRAVERFRHATRYFISAPASLSEHSGLS
jgi:hypothetical protein